MKPINELDAIERAVLDLERFQQAVGQQQMELLVAMLHGSSDVWDADLEEAVKRLGNIQGHIGSLQSQLIAVLRRPTNLAALPSRPQASDAGSGASGSASGSASASELAPGQGDSLPQPQFEQPGVPVHVPTLRLLQELARLGEFEFVPTPLSVREWQLRYVALAITEGQRYLGGLMHRLRIAVSSHAMTTLDFSLRSGVEAAHCYLLALKLADAGMMDHVTLRKSPHRLQADLTADTDDRRWLTGRWLEVSAYLLAHEEFSRWTHSAQQWELHSGVRVRRGDLLREVDLIGQFPSGELFWAECKTGSWNEFIPKAKDICDLLGTHPDNSILILPEVTDGDLQSARYHQAPLQLHTPSSFREWVKGRLLGGVRP